MEDHVSRFLDEMAAYAAPRTVRTVRDILVDWVAWSGARGLDVGALRYLDVSAYVGERARRWAPQTMKQHLTYLNVYHEYLVDTGALAANPWRKVKIPKVSSLEPPDFLRLEDFDRIDRLLQEAPPGETLLQAALRLRDRAILRLLFHAGLRRAELCGLRVRDVDLDAAGRTARVFGKGRKHRVVCFDSLTRDVLEAYLRDARPRLLGNARGVDALFVSYRHAALGDHSVHRMVVKRGQRAGVGHVWPHLCRHGFATHLRKKRVDLRVLQELLGHSSIYTTQRYAHVDAADLREAYDQAYSD